MAANPGEPRKFAVYFKNNLLEKGQKDVKDVEDEL